jgi:hypothetical protein
MTAANNELLIVYGRLATEKNGSRISGYFGALPGARLCLVERVREGNQVERSVAKPLFLGRIAGKN